MKIVIPNERPMSWNQLYAGRHWSFRQKEADRVHGLLWEAKMTYHNVILHAPITIKITVYFKNRPLDPDNICTKLYIDGLKNWLIKDDSSKYIEGVMAVSRVDKDNPRVEIDIIKSNNPL